MRGTSDRAPDRGGLRCTRPGSTRKTWSESLRRRPRRPRAVLPVWHVRTRTGSARVRTAGRCEALITAQGGVGRVVLAPAAPSTAGPDMEVRSLGFPRHLPPPRFRRTVITRSFAVPERDALMTAKGQPYRRAHIRITTLESQ